VTFAGLLTTICSSTRREGNMNEVSRVGEMSDGQTWGRRQSETARRKRLLRPVVLGLAAIMIFVTLLSMVAAGATASSPSTSPACPSLPTAHNGSSGPQPECGGCTPTDEGPVDITDVQVTPEPTNVTVSWDEGPTDAGAFPAPTLYFANSSSWPSNEFSQTASGSTPYSVFLSFLEPSTTYDYEIVAPPPAEGCTEYWTQGTYTGSWVTTAESNYINASGYYISGTVYNAAGTHAPAGVEVWVNCVTLPGNWYASGLTNSEGQYSIDVFYEWSAYGPYTYYGEWTGAQGGFEISVKNGLSGTWAGYWNQTIVTWVPQVVDFELPDNFVTGSIPQIADYTNANISNGFPNSSMEYTTGTTYTTSSSHCWTALYVFSGCSEASNALTTNSGYDADGHNLVVTQQLWESGTMLFDPFSRQWSMTSEDYYQAFAPPVNEPASWPSQDTLVPGNSSLYLLYAWGGETDKGVMVYSTSPDQGQVTTSSTSTSYHVKGFDIGISVGAYGVGAGTTLVTDRWSQTSSYTSTDTLSWTVYGSSETVPVCYVVYGVGGASSSTSTTADAVGLWAYAPTASDGSYTCPLPGPTPSGPAPNSNCFGGSPCTGSSGTSAGKGTTCTVSSFSETAGDFMYVAINYLAGTDLITSVADGGTDTFQYLGGEFANSQSVAFYDVTSEHGGTVSITVTISTAEFGTCRVGQLSPGTTVGVVGTGESTASGTSLSLTNAASHEPSLLLAMIGSTRPSGAYTMSTPSGSWLTGGQQPTGYNPGTESGLYGYNDTSSGSVTFAFTTGSSVSISGIAIEFYL